MAEVLLIVGVALAGALAVALPGALLLRRLRGRPVSVHIWVLLTVTVGGVVAGVVAVAWAMFLSPHDLQVLLIVVATAATASAPVSWWLGRRLAREAVWADEARRREREAEAARRELVAWVSHDLRTPLAGLRAMAEALEDDVVTDPATVRDYHGRIRAETDRMTRLVDDLFELSRIHARALRLSLAAVPLGDLVSDAIASAAPVAEAAGVRLYAAETGWPTVTASEPELARVLANLLRNAIHYTPYDGTVSVTGGCDRDVAWLAVADTCGGIPEPDLPRVFDVAFRAERSRTPAGLAGGGGGLGLAIVRGLVEAQGGRVEVANCGPGCRFVVHLPAG